MNVSALDISPSYEHFIQAITPCVPFARADVFDHQQSYDIVIQHLDDPIPFCRRLQKLARHAVFVIAPFNEPRENMTNGHVQVIDDDTVAQLDPVEWVSVNSVSWGAFANPPYEMLIARLAPQAG
jgi:hypothetical protein